jgi:hypothetical protein
MLVRCCAVPEPKARPVFKLPKRVRRVAKPEPPREPIKKTTDEVKDLFDKTNDMWKGMTDTFDLDEE